MSKVKYPRNGYTDRVRRIIDEVNTIPSDAGKAKIGVDLLIAARAIFDGIDNKHTAERCRAAISSARGAVRIQYGRSVRCK